MRDKPISRSAWPCDFLYTRVMLHNLFLDSIAVSFSANGMRWIDWDRVFEG